MQTLVHTFVWTKDVPISIHKPQLFELILTTTNKFLVRSWIPTNGICLQMYRVTSSE